MEFFGDQIESLREFDIDTQTSVRDLRSVDILLNQGAADQSGSVRDYIRETDLIIDVEPEETSDAHVQISEGWIEQSGHSERSRGIPLQNQKAAPRDPSTPKAFGAQDDKLLS